MRNLLTLNKFIVKTVKLNHFFFLIGCATPEVVNVKDPLDDKKNCNELESSVAEAQKFKRDV